MNANDVIEIYVDDTVRDLPGRDRADVAAELRTLFHEELQAQTTNQGQVPTPEMAISLVRAYGRPSEVAARYHTPWTIIAPAESKSFARAAIIGIGAMVLFSHATDHRPWVEKLAEAMFKN